MSAAPIYTRAQQERPQQRPVQRRRKKPAGASLMARTIAWSVAFSAISTLTFGFSTLLGHSLKETARRDAIRSGERAKAARADVSRIRARVERVTTIAAVDEWSKFKGFVSSYHFAKAAAPVQVKKQTIAKKLEPKVEVLVARLDNGSDVQ